MAATEGVRERLINEESDSGVENSSDDYPNYTIKVPKCPILVEPYMFLISFGVIASNPLMAQYLYAKFSQAYPVLVNNTNVPSSETCKTINTTEDMSVYNATQELQAQTSQWMMYLSTLSNIPGIFSTIIIGGYSDKLYRKPAMLLPTIGQFVKALTVFLVIYFQLDIRILLGSSVLDGLCGSYPAMVMGVFSYISDTIPGESRGLRLVILEVIFVVSGATADISVGFLIKHTGFTIPAVGVASVFSLCLFYVYFLIPETHVLLPDAIFHIKDCFTSTAKTYMNSESYRRPKLLLLLLILYFSWTPIVGNSTVSVLYQMNYPLCWNSDLIGVYLAVSLLVVQFSSLISIFTLSRCLSDPFITLFGVISGLASFVVYSQATTTVEVFFCPVIGAFALLPQPLIRAIGSSLVSPQEQGGLFSGMACVQTIGVLTASVGFNAIYKATLTVMPGASFLVCAALLLVCAVFIIIFIVYSKVTSADNRYNSVL